MSYVLEVDDLSVSFGGLDAVREVSLQVAEGTIVGLIGPNGAGKTTTLNLLSGLISPTKGSIRLRGQEISALKAERRAALGIGRSFQNLGLIHDETVLTNLLASQHLATGYRNIDVVVRPWRWRRQERELARRAGEMATAFGLHDLLDERVADLSFAQARFAELACVLSQDPALLLLDEPTTGLDLGETRHLISILESQRAARKAIVVVAHDMRFIMELCDDIYVLALGSVLFNGDSASVQRNPQVIATYLGRAA